MGLISNPVILKDKVKTLTKTGKDSKCQRPSTALKTCDDLKTLVDRSGPQRLQPTGIGNDPNGHPMTKTNQKLQVNTSGS